MTMEHRHEDDNAMRPALPLVGVGAIVLREGKVLLGKRLGSHGAGSWALPGGHLEFGETVEACARREVLEECGLELGVVVPGPYTSDVFEEAGRHYVTLFVIAQSAAGEPQCLEPTKCAGWCWFAWGDLPRPLFAPLASLSQMAFDPTAIHAASAHPGSPEMRDD
jgi:8-oxo-dGTP diphosphatase